MFKLFLFQLQNAIKIGNKTAINHLHGEITDILKKGLCFSKQSIYTKIKNKKILNHGQYYKIPSK